jgi:hypothetical protein
MIFDGAAIVTGTPASVSVRASPNPVGPASYAAATGPCCSAIPATHRATASLPGGSFTSMTSPVDVSNAAARTLRACTSKPIAVR